jgi:integrase/recombinase XerD
VSRDLTVIGNTGGGLSFRARIDGAGDRAAGHSLALFNVNIRNRNTWAPMTGPRLLSCVGVKAGDWRTRAGSAAAMVAAYIEQLQVKQSAPTVNQYLACIQILFDWPVIGQVMPLGPLHSVLGPRHSERWHNAGTRENDRPLRPTQR